jgi:endonuclease/exonuclease/phosphatase family metal-dependent hydrolase
VSAYIPPGSDAADVQLMLSPIARLADEGVSVILLGDLNAKHHSWSGGNNNAFGTLVHDWCEQHDFVVVNSLLPAPVSTFRGASASTLDLAVVSDPSIIDRLSVRRDLPLRSDHWPIVLSLDDAVQAQGSASSHASLVA